MQDSLIVFNHIPRTSGSSIHASFDEALKSRNFFVFNGSLEDEQKFAAAFNDRGAGVFYTGGHIGFQRLQKLGLLNDENLLFSIVRDPVERMLSLYYLMRRSPDWQPHIAAHVGDRDFAYYYDFCREKGFHTGNAQCRAIAGVESFEAARERVSQHYSLVGCLSHVAMTYNALEVIVRNFLPEFRYLGPMNEAPRDGQTISSGLAERIRQDSSEDCLLVDFIERDCGGLFSRSLQRWSLARG
ncbi:sulfotransferase family 2 domain-containing protein [Methylocystis sp. ATCC 49242]|uniref:sulfotransferase family 2 domain-containing protein n=1 Tax=Methylocystis sp. ATCC 49242 TaxID=622637 RepID=UPI0001F86CAF|nr:sulfotransferase family 2 domain-containing protein [Methylocystis sp. ATCC 49242]